AWHRRAAGARARGAAVGDGAAVAADVAGDSDRLARLPPRLLRDGVHQDDALRPPRVPVPRPLGGGVAGDALRAWASVVATGLAALAVAAGTLSGGDDGAVRDRLLRDLPPAGDAGRGVGV